MARRIAIVCGLLVMLTAGCAGPPAPTTTPTLTPSLPPLATLRPSETLPPPTATIPLVGSATPTPHPTDANAQKPILNTKAEAANKGRHSYSYGCYAWEPCTCLVVVPTQFEITFSFSGRSVDLLAGDFSQTFTWRSSDSYLNSLGSLVTQLTFFEDGFELYTVIDQRSCTQERYTLRPENP